MSELSYEDITRIKGLTNDVIAKTCTLKDINLMIQSMANEKAEYRPVIQIGPRRVTIPPDEYYWVTGALKVRAVHLEHDIEDLKSEICAIFEKKEEETKDDRDLPESEGEVQ